MIDNFAQVEAGFVDELEKIGWNPAKFFAGGARNWSKLISGKGVAPAGMGVGQHIKSIYQSGAAGKGGMWGGIKALGRSRYGQMAGTAAVPVAAGYVAHKAIS